MHNTRNSLRRNWLYLLVIVVSTGYAVAPPSRHQQDLDRARAAVQMVIVFLGDRWEARQ